MRHHSKRFSGSTRRSTSPKEAASTDVGRGMVFRDRDRAHVLGKRSLVLLSNRLSVSNILRRVKKLWAYILGDFFCM